MLLHNLWLQLKVKGRTIQKEVVVVRRSSRVANLPTPVYKDVVVDRVTIPRRTYNSHRDYSKRVYASDEAREEALNKAEKLCPDEKLHLGIYNSFIHSGVTWKGLSCPSLHE